MPEAGTGAVREILVVLVLAMVGLLLAVVAAFAPWYADSAGAGETAVVEMHAPEMDESDQAHVAVDAG
jgi:hypothetical protein